MLASSSTAFQPLHTACERFHRPDGDSQPETELAATESYTAFPLSRREGLTRARAMSLVENLENTTVRSSLSSPSKPLDDSFAVLAILDDAGLTDVVLTRRVVFNLVVRTACKAGWAHTRNSK